MNNRPSLLRRQHRNVQMNMKDTRELIVEDRRFSSSNVFPVVSSSSFCKLVSILSPQSAALLFSHIFQLFQLHRLHCTSSPRAPVWLLALVGGSCEFILFVWHHTRGMGEKIQKGEEPPLHSDHEAIRQYWLKYSADYYLKLLKMDSCKHFVVCRDGIFVHLLSVIFPLVDVLSETSWFLRVDLNSRSHCNRWRSIFNLLLLDWSSLTVRSSKRVNLVTWFYAVVWRENKGAPLCPCWLSTDVSTPSQSLFPNSKELLEIPTTMLKWGFFLKKGFFVAVKSRQAISFEQNEISSSVVQCYYLISTLAKRVCCDADQSDRE